MPETQRNLEYRLSADDEYWMLRQVFEVLNRATSDASYRPTRDGIAREMRAAIGCDSRDLRESEEA